MDEFVRRHLVQNPTAFANLAVPFHDLFFSKNQGLNSGLWSVLETVTCSKHLLQMFHAQQVPFPLHDTIEFFLFPFAFLQQHIKKEVQPAMGGGRNQTKVFSPIEEIYVKIPEAVGKTHNFCQFFLETKGFPGIKHPLAQADDRTNLAQGNAIIMEKFAVAVGDDVLFILSGDVKKGPEYCNRTFLHRGFRQKRYFRFDAVGPFLKGQAAIKISNILTGLGAAGLKSLLEIGIGLGISAKIMEASHSQQLSSSATYG